MSELIVSEDDKNFIQATGLQNHVEVANSLVVNTKEDAQAASDINGELAKSIKHLQTVRKNILAPAKKALEEYTAQADAYCKPAIDDMTQARQINLTKIGAWQDKENKRIAAEAEERESKEREARQKAEREIAAEIAKSTAKADELQKKADQEADAEKKAKALADIAKIQENTQHKVEKLHTEAVAQTDTAPKESTKIAGMTMKDSWSAEHEGFSEDEAKMTLIKACADGRPDLAAYLTLNMTALNGVARAMKKNFNIAGFKAVNKPRAAGARR
jgi:hypothetical protein